MASSLERHYGARGVHGLAVHPGGIWTPLQKHIPAELMEVYKKNEEINTFVKSTEQGAASTVLAAIGKEYEGRGGLYLEDCGEWGPVKGDRYTVLDGGYEGRAFDEEGEERLWGVSLGMVGLEGDVVG
jgi:hypothetical protein